MIKKTTFFAFLIILFFCLFTSNSFAVDIPENVMAAATELNFGRDNFVILQDENGLLYAAHFSNLNSNTKPWQVCTYEENICLVGPDWPVISLHVYDSSAGEFVSTSSNSLDSNSVIQLSNNERKLSIVYAFQDVTVRDPVVEGFEVGDVFFPLPVVEGTIAPLLEKEKMAETVKEIVAVLPVVLTIVITFLAFRKAWIILTTLIRKA